MVSGQKSATTKGESPSRLIDARIKELDDWRGKTLSHVRALIKQADPEVVEEWKWRGVPVWLDLTRFSGHITVTQRGVHNVEERQEIHERISVPDGTACTSGPRDSGAFQGIWSFDLVN